MKMNRCGMTDSRLNDYFDGVLSQEDARETARHVENCEACSDTLMDLGSLRAGVRDMPNSVAPARDLWPELAGKLRSRSSLARRVPGYVQRVAALVMAAAAVLVFCVVSTFRETMQLQGTNDNRPATSQMPVEIVSAEETYVDATSSLFSELEMHRRDLPPETVQIVEENLNITGSAIHDVRIALENDPGNADLSRRLMDIHGKQVKLLQHVMEIPFAVQKGGAGAI